MMTATTKIVAVAGVVLLGVVSSPALAQRQMELLGRGVVAIPQGGAKVFVGWRLLGTDPEDIGFNVYRSTSGRAPVKLNPEPLRNATGFVDSGANSDEGTGQLAGREDGRNKARSL
jgi:rhamnogalacturonan endolyase